MMTHSVSVDDDLANPEACGLTTDGNCYVMGDYQFLRVTVYHHQPIASNASNDIKAE
ncbi:MAG: hypothetical protein KA343_00930 [Nitrosomonas sp.]|nr:hypothetical protein [Nitrosomonas sp.]